MGSEAARIHDKIRSFKRKYYLDLFIRGLILSVSILLVYFLLAAILEHNLWLGPWARFITFFTFFAVAIFCLFRFLWEPLQWWIANKGLTEEESARLIGLYIPAVRDRLVNYIQLENNTGNTLAYASLLQKTREFEPLSFDSVIDIRQNRKYLKYLLIPLLTVLVIFVFNSKIITGSAQRIIHFSREYSPEAPFTFSVSDKALTGFYNEDYNLLVELKGSAVPASAYLNLGQRRIKLDRKSAGVFTHTFEKLQQPFDFQVEAAGFFSEQYHLAIKNRPELSQLKIELEYPRYLNRKNEEIFNTGNIEIPEGTSVTWKIRSAFADSVHLDFSADSLLTKTQRSDKQLFTYTKSVLQPDVYEILLKNSDSRNRDRISYTMDVIKDQYPSISVNNMKDTVLYKRVLIGGLIGDDHGISKLALVYNIRGADGGEVKEKQISIPVRRDAPQQNFFFNWAVDSLTLRPGDQLSYYLQVWDNDAVNGRKSSRSSHYTFAVPGKDDMMVEIKKSQSQTEQKIDQSVGKAKKLQDQIEDATQKLKGKQNLDWKDKKMLEDIIQQKEGLDQMVEQLKEQNKLLDQKKDAFTEQNERIREKAEQIQKLMDQLLDEETKKLFEELQRLLKENANLNDIQKILNKLNQNSDNLEKELERTLELFKDLQYDFKMEQSLNDLKKQIEAQEKILQKTREMDKSGEKGKESGKERKQQSVKQGENPEEANKSNESNESGDLAKEQEKLKQDVSKNGEQLKELKKLGEELHKDEPLPTEQEMDELMKDQEESQEMLEKDDPAKAISPQQKSLQKMQQMKEQMESSQNQASMEMDMENLESLRQILHGLVKLSFTQEDLMKRYGEMSPNDPGFNSIAQKQLKLKDDLKVLEDSLLALGKRDPFMGAVVTREVGELKGHLNKVTEANKERRKPQAATAMQAAMTSMNNLALMLDDHFEMMMEMMAKAKAKMGKGKPKDKGSKPSLSQMQEQLNKRIQDLKGSGKTGKELSEELAEMAAEQERIRKALQQMQEKMKDGKMPGGDLPGKMEQTEMELVNKQLSDQLIQRQKQILTRLLETEKSAREQDLDEERKGETAKEYDKEIPKAFEEYLRLKEKEVELLKTVPPKLYPYYKKEVSEYFKRMGS